MTTFGESKITASRSLAPVHGSGLLQQRFGMSRLVGDITGEAWLLFCDLFGRSVYWYIKGNQLYLCRLPRQKESPIFNAEMNDLQKTKNESSKVKGSKIVLRRSL